MSLIYNLKIINAWALKQTYSRFAIMTLVLEYLIEIERDRERLLTMSYGSGTVDLVEISLPNVIERIAIRDKVIGLLFLIRRFSKPLTVDER